MRIIFIALIALVFFNACGDSSSQEAAAVVVSSDEKSFEESKSAEVKQTKFVLTTTTGEKIDIELVGDSLVSKSLNGKVVLLNFWATWCPPCIKEMPMFVKMYEEYKDKFIIIGVTYEREKDLSKDSLNAFMKKHNMNFPVTVGNVNFELAKAMGDVKRIPESFLYTKTGMFIEKFVGEVDEVTLKWNIEQNKDD